MTQNQINRMEYILEPPDGGWGYMIALGMCVLLVRKLEIKKKN